MDIIEKNIGHVSEISDNGSEILDQNDKTSSLPISSQRPDSQNLSNNKQDSSDHTNTQGVDLYSIRSTVPISDQFDSNENLHASGNSDGVDLSSIKPTVPASDQLDSNDKLHASANSDGAELSSIKSTAPVSDQFDSNENLHASGNSDSADLSSIKSTISASDHSDSNANLDASGDSDSADLSSIKSTVPVRDNSNCKGNLHASGHSDGADLSTIKSTVSTSDEFDSNDNLYANGNPDGVDLFRIKSTISVSDKSDNKCAGILIVNDKVNNPDKLCDTDSLVFPSGKFGSSVNPNSKLQEPDAPKANTGSGVISNDNPENGTFSPGNPVSCDFSSDEPWNENFPKRKSRSSGFFSENIWGSNYSSDNPVSCGFSSDDFSGVKVENGDDSSNQSRSDDFSSQKISGGGISNGKPETCGFSSNNPWSDDFSNEKTRMPISLDVLNKNSADSKHSNSSLDANSDTSSAMTETSNKLSADSNFLNGNSCSTTKESKNTDISCEELDKAEASSNCFENPIRYCKDLDITESFAIETSEIPSYLIETSGVLGNDPSKCKTEKEINDIYISSCKYPDYESQEKVDQEIEVNADGNWKIEKCHQSTVFVIKRIDENAPYKFKCIYFNKGTKLDELFKNRSHDELNVSQDEILECIDSVKDDQLNFIECPVESNDQSGFLEDRMGTSESEVAIADGTIEKCHQSTVFVLKRIDENAQHKFKCIYFNKKAKLDELFQNISNVDLNVSQEEILDCIDSIKENQLNFIEDPVESNDQSGLLEDRMGTSLEMIDEDLVDNELAHKNAKEQIILIVDKMLNDEFLTMAKNKENLDLTDLDIKLGEIEMVENALLDDVKNVLIYDQIFSSKLGVNLENELIGSKVQDISGYQSSTETNINDSVNETPNTRIEMNTFSIHQTMLNCVKIVGETIFSVMLGVLGYVFHKTKSLASTECATNQTIPETVTDVEKFQYEMNATNGPSTSLTNSRTVPSESLKMKTRITNFSTLFQHLSATVGTDMTAERVMKDINSQVVMDIYNGFHELRIVDYGSLDLMSKCIKGCIITLQRTLTHSDPIVLKASELLRKKTNTLEEMRKMNEDLKELTSDAEAHLHSIDRVLTGLEDYTDDFMYYKNAISKELVEFLLEDFPEIFK